jgi:hypothetical protein
VRSNVSGSGDSGVSRSIGLRLCLAVERQALALEKLCGELQVLTRQNAILLDVLMPVPNDEDELEPGDRRYLNER